MSTDTTLDAEHAAALDAIPAPAAPGAAETIQGRQDRYRCIDEFTVAATHLSAAGDETFAPHSRGVSLQHGNVLIGQWQRWISPALARKLGQALIDAADFYDAETARLQAAGLPA